MRLTERLTRLERRSPARLGLTAAQFQRLVEAQALSELLQQSRDPATLTREQRQAAVCQALPEGWTDWQPIARRWLKVYRLGPRCGLRP